MYCNGNKCSGFGLKDGLIYVDVESVERHVFSSVFNDLHFTDETHKEFDVYYGVFRPVRIVDDLQTGHAQVFFEQLRGADESAQKAMEATERTEALLAYVAIMTGVDINV